LLIAVGSPGNSAQYLNLGGMGPITLKPDMTTTPNDNTVTNYANVIFIDLLGNGYSFAANSSSYSTKAEDYGVHLTYAINAFAKQSVLGQSKIVALIG
jgi:carboxypeptidase C (cathepsin A)